MPLAGAGTLELEIPAAESLILLGFRLGQASGGGSSLLRTALSVDFPVIRELTGKISQFWLFGPLGTRIKLVESGS
jgi:hypothetical protein